MRNITRPISLLLLLFMLCCQERKANEQQINNNQYYQPWESFPELFAEVQNSSVYNDSKTFVDCIPKVEPSAIAEAYSERSENPEFNLEAFVHKYFLLPPDPPSFTVDSTLDFKSSLTAKWDQLTRENDSTQTISSLIPLPKEYVVPGGRFREIYYWDSYFTMIGLGVSGRTDLITSMVANFAYLIDTIGFVPNGNRTYYLGRSQPPFFSSMVNLLMKLTNDSTGLEYLSAIQKEYDFWMQGSASMSNSKRATDRVVWINDSTILNRYWDKYSTPRPESYKEDVELAEHLPDDQKPHLYRNLRAGAESGWDYSTRWFENKDNFSTIRTTEIIPVDLNCLLYRSEMMLSKLYQLNGNKDSSERYKREAAARARAIKHLLWNEDLGAFTDLVWKSNKMDNQVTLACAYPLYFEICSDRQAESVAEVLERDFLLPGGLVTTKINSGQQWDYPNGWAPLQWIASKGLEHYHFHSLADEISDRWISLNKRVYATTGKMMEKYNVADTTLTAGGGEYPTQDGFGWTNGVALGFMSEDAIY